MADRPRSAPPEARHHGPSALGARPDVGVEVFSALDIRVGHVRAVEPFPEARQAAWKLTVDFGPILGELRTSAKVTNYPADALVGRQVVGVVNLGRKRIAGFVSEFLVLGALDVDGTVRLLEVDGELPPGAPIA